MLILTFHNDGTARQPYGHYEVKVWVNDELIRTGRVENHNRDRGWLRLVEKWVKEELKPNES